MGSSGISRVETAVRVVLKFNDAFNHHDIKGVLKLISDDCIFESNDPAPDGTLYVGKKAITTYLNNVFNSTPNGFVEIEDIFGFSVRCILRWKYIWVNGTEKKEYIRGVDLFQVQNKLICEKTSYVKGQL